MNKDHRLSSDLFSSSFKKMDLRGSRGRGIKKDATDRRCMNS